MTTRNKFPLEIERLPHIAQLAKEAANQLGCTEILTKAFLEAAFVAAQVFDYKQSKYGPDNIAEFGETGVMIRCNDKIKRLANLWRKGETPTDESIEDSWGDLANYGLIALMCRWGMWPGVQAASARARKANRNEVLSDLRHGISRVLAADGTNENKLVLILQAVEAAQ